MELWIRSQDKTFLKKVNTIGIVEGRDFWRIDENLTASFGKYKTKERALEILDEIQHSFTSKRGMITSQSANSIEFIPYNDQIVIYEMPKE